jgi:hypothetical protein
MLLAQEWLSTDQAFRNSRRTRRVFLENLANHIHMHGLMLERKWNMLEELRLSFQVGRMSLELKFHASRTEAEPTGSLSFPIVKRDPVDLPAFGTIPKATERGLHWSGNSRDAAAARAGKRPVIKQLMNVGPDLPIITESSDLRG